MNNFFLAFLLIFENINEMKHQHHCYEALKQTKLIWQYKVEFTKIVQLLQSISVKYKQKQQFIQNLKQKIWFKLWKYLKAEVTTLNELVWQVNWIEQSLQKVHNKSHLNVFSSSNLNHNNLLINSWDWSQSHERSTMSKLNKSDTETYWT